MCSNKNGLRDYHTKWSKSGRERYISYDITYVWNLKYYTNEPTYKTETESQIYRALTATGTVGVVEGWIGSLGLADANYYE